MTTKITAAVQEPVTPSSGPPMVRPAAALANNTSGRTTASRRRTALRVPGHVLQ